ncbi:MAG TPA: sensor histidine kinase [Steroidobacteraceae bacterium]|nr:sensor histidine kinase [Steroidobacteraceae bacterium]
MRQALRGGAESFYLPDFCTSRAALAIVLIAELTAIVLALARQGQTAGAALDFWADLARTSLFLLWVGLVCAALLCWTRRRLERLTVARGSVAVLALLTAAIAAISAAAYFLGRSQVVLDAGTAEFFPSAARPFLLRNMAIGFVIIAVALRYFYVTHQWRRNIEMRAAARVHALQARIRPHFLFNSMNTIASLTRSDAVLAEQAVQDLADLFRASLSDQHQTITLAEELEVARTYQRIEELRLGPRLHVEWDVDRLPSDARVPGLLLQPLLENAIYHGIEPRRAGGTVSIVGELAGELITIVVRNPVAERQSEREGNRLALANIRERLALLYGELALVKAGRFGDEYIVTLRFPHVSAAQQQPGAPGKPAVRGRGPAQ